MKTIKLYLILAIAGVFAMASCKKTETKDYAETYNYDVHHSPTDGQARIKGNVTFANSATGTNDIAPWSVIKISTDTVTKVFSQYWMTDSLGAYSVKGLAVGSYFITAQYTDQFTGAKFNSPGAIVTVNNTATDITLNFLTK